MQAVEINGAARAFCLEADLAVRFSENELYVFMLVGGDTDREWKSIIYAIEGYAQDNGVIVSDCDVEYGWKGVVSVWEGKPTLAECSVHRVSVDVVCDTMDMWTSISNVKSVRVQNGVVLIDLYDDALVCLGRLLRNLLGKEKE